MVTPDTEQTVMQDAKLEAKTIIVVGRGRMGTALARSLSAANLRVVGPLGRADVQDRVASRPGDVVILAVTDSAISEVASRVTRGALVGHVSGATPLDALTPHDSFVMHPLVSVADGDHTFDGATATVSGTSEDLTAVARGLAHTLGLRAIPIREQDRAAYHAAASIASNYLVTVEGFAERLAAEVGIDRDALAPLVRASVENWVKYGAERALTGPISRGDSETVRLQREAIERLQPEQLPLFDALADATRALVRQRDQSENITP